MVVALEKETPVYAEPSAAIRSHEKEPFGIYRPFTPESAAEVSGVLACAEIEVESYLNRERQVKTADMLARSEFGVTYLRRDRVRAALMSPKFKNGFDH